MELLGISDVNGDAYMPCSAMGWLLGALVSSTIGKGMVFLPHDCAEGKPDSLASEYIPLLGTLSFLLFALQAGSQTLGTWVE